MNTKVSPLISVKARLPEHGICGTETVPQTLPALQPGWMDKSITAEKPLVSPNIEPVHFPAIGSVVVAAITAVGAGGSVGGTVVVPDGEGVS